VGWSIGAAIVVDFLLCAGGLYASFHRWARVPRLSPGPAAATANRPCTRGNEDARRACLV
jgi:hypothetical protein